MTVVTLTSVGDDVAVILPEETLTRLGWQLGDVLVAEPVGERGIGLRRSSDEASANAGIEKSEGG